MSEPNFEIPELPSGSAPRDGIGEEDNAVPLWFNAAWIATWIVGIAYIVWYLGISDWSQEAQYRAEAAVAAEQAAAVRAALPSENPYHGDAAAIAEGKETFGTICLACHGPEGKGLVGPSLVDPYWKYGATDADHFKAVAEGLPGGMPPWGAALGNEKIWKVLAYVATLPRTTEPGFGAPDYVPPPPPAP